MTEDTVKRDREETSPQTETADQESAQSCDAANANDVSAISQEDMDKVLSLVQEKKQKLEEQLDQLKRLQADFDNFRRRSRQEKEELSAVITQNLLGDFLPVIDNFERALSAAPGEDSAALRSGVEMIYRQFLNLLSQKGVEPLPAVGEMFDPKFHEAVARVEDESQPDGVILAELQKGYKFRNKVLRPSMVKVVSHA